MTGTNSYKYLGHIITDNLSDEADLEDKERGLYRRCNALLRTFHFCSDEVKNKLFTCYCSNVYLCSLWVKFRKSAMHHFIVSYNNAFRILHGLPMRCSASGMFASSGVSSVLPRPFLQGGTPCPFQEAEMTPCRLLVTPRDALLYFTWPRTSQSAVIGAETMRFPYFGIRHRNPTHL